MFRFLSIVLSLGLSFQVWAGKKEGWDAIAKTPVFCEHYLTGKASRSALLSLNKQLFSRPFPFQDISEVSRAALKKLGFDPQIGKLDPSNLVLSIDKPQDISDEIFALKVRIHLFKSGSLSQAAVYNLPDASPSLWNMIYLSDREMELDHAELNVRFPLTPGAFNLESSYIGYHSDPDIEGIRRYVSAHLYRGDRLVNVEVGIDVPCARYADFAGEDQVAENLQLTVLTSASRFCRIPVVYFSSSAI